VGEDVFGGRSVVEVCGHHLHSEPVAPSGRVEGGVPFDLEAVLLSCLAKAPAERPESASDLRQRLRRCAAFGTWEDETAREWWGRHADGLAARRGSAAARMSGQSLIVDFAGRGGSPTPVDRVSVTGTAPPGSGWAGPSAHGKGETT
jgi:hypothetical protein